ncbi:MAG TPA: Pycsar system effector family protein [Candidatus Acidoferrum sp.]|nr:Pycsar system effector family protein [Candidatus Acidoferrum sp.]
MADAEAERLHFAWKNFEDQQAIIRAADLKAGYLVTFLLFFGASTIPLGREVFPKLQWAGAGAFASGMYVGTYVLSVIGFVWSMYLISHVMTPRVSRHHKEPRPGADLLYFGHVTRFESSEKYYEAVAHAQPEQILRNVTDQIFELAQIARVKMDNLRAFSKSFKLTLVAWFLSTAVGFWIMSWK